ncbi:MAG: NAD(P)/FAD-dependent oxidoreductase [Candidatus Lokiarchaeota archaeon]|nr:NAD(P)/FAD-dependent oxidoreductase [Candidatus Lokiarchaeota archaeon]
MRLVVVGNGVAGMKVAEDVRKYDSSAQIILFDEERYGYYSRVWLPALVSGAKTPESIIMRDADWYKARSIDFRPGTRVTRIDPKGRRVTAEPGGTLDYDKLCIATGASCNLPPFKNAGITGVFTLRTIDDAISFKEYIKGKKRAVCIGGGLLGLEAARNVKKAGLDTTVVEVFPRLLPRQLCSTSAGMLTEQVHGLGIGTVLGATVEEILGTDHVTGVKLAGNRILDADVVLVSAGIKPRTDLAVEAGLKVNKAVVVDEFMQTSDENIFAAGDVVEFGGKGWGIIPAALEQAAVAAKRIAGEPCEPYTPTVPSNKLRIMDFDVMSAGSAILDDADQNCRVFISKDEMRGVFKKFVVRDGKLVGSILLQAKNDEGFVSRNINKEVPEEEIKKRVDTQG